MDGIEKLFLGMIITAAVFLGFLALLSHGITIQCISASTKVEGIGNVNGNYRNS